MYATLRVSKGDNGVERGVANQAVREGFLEAVTIPLKCLFSPHHIFKPSLPTGEASIVFICLPTFPCCWENVPPPPLEMALYSPSPVGWPVILSLPFVRGNWFKEYPLNQSDQFSGVFCPPIEVRGVAPSVSGLEAVSVDFKAAGAKSLAPLRILRG